MPISGSLGSKSEDILHFNAIRFRVTGSGNLRIKLIGLDGITEQTLIPLVMSSAPGREPQRLANFQGQRVQFELKTTEIDEIFRINRIIPFAKTIWSEFPG